MGLIARALEIAGVPATLTSWSPGRTRATAPPRATFTRLVAGRTLGQPEDVAQQRRILKATLALLEQEAPLEPVMLDETTEEI